MRNWPRKPGKSILVVDDGEANRQLITLVLQRAGAQVTAVENGFEAIKVLSEHDFDLIFMDMQMPVLDGHSATRRIRSTGLKTPIVALTGSATEGDREKCLEAGCDDFLSKPVDPDQLLRCTARHLGMAREQDTWPTKDDFADAKQPSSTRRDHAEGGIRSPVIPISDPIHSTLPMDDEAFREIAVEFIERLESRMDEISQSLSALDFDAVRSDAHWLKGVGGTVGFPDFTEPASALEEAAKNDDAQQAVELLAAIEEIRSRVVIPDDESTPADEPTLAAVPAPSSTDPLAATPLADLSPIQCTLPIDDPRFCRIVRDFVHRLDDRLVEMKELFDAGQFEELADAAHWLKGSGGTVGYMEFFEPALALEEAAKRRSREDAHRCLQDVLAVRQRIVVPDSAGK